MVTMLDCIKRSTIKLNEIVTNSDVNTDGMIKALKDDLGKIRKITVIGSGSSYNSGLTAQAFMEKVSGMEVQVYLPNEFRKKTVYNPESVYIFVSQTGTSTLVREEAIMASKLGLHTVSMTESPDTPIAKVTESHVEIGCGYEEFGYRTVGVCCSILTLCVIALRLGLEKGHLTTAQYQEYLRDAAMAADNQPVVIDKTLTWFENNKKDLLDCRALYYFGGGSLHGIAVEGALKLLETARLYCSAGYEAEDGLHGPNLAFSDRDVVVSLNEGREDDFYAKAAARFGKGELKAGYIVGCNTEDEKDLSFEYASENFTAIEAAPVVQIIAYMMAIENNVPVMDSEHRIPHCSDKYFKTHDR